MNSEPSANEPIVRNPFGVPAKQSPLGKMSEPQRQSRFTANQRLALKVVSTHKLMIRRFREFVTKVAQLERMYGKDEVADHLEYLLTYQKDPNNNYQPSLNDSDAIFDKRKFDAWRLKVQQETGIYDQDKTLPSWVKMGDNYPTLTNRNGETLHHISFVDNCYLFPSKDALISVKMDKETNKIITEITKTTEQGEATLWMSAKKED